jgi:hypothetical protein
MSIHIQSSLLSQSKPASQVGFALKSSVGPHKNGTAKEPEFIDQNSVEIKKIDLEDTTQGQYVTKLETMRVEIFELRRVEEELKLKNKLISDLEKKVK